MTLDTAGSAQGAYRAARHTVYLQVLLRQGQPLFAELSRSGLWKKGCASWARSSGRSACPCSPTYTRTRPSNEVAASWTCCRPRPFCAARRTSSTTWPRPGIPVNIKKGQFLAPWDMKNVVEKARADRQRADHGLRARRQSFGYNNLVSDMRSLAVMRDTGCPVVFDATHSVQMPGGQGTSSGGQREFVPVLARAAVAVGVAGPVHGEPTRIPRRPSATDPIPGRSTGWGNCSKPCWR